MKDDNKVDEDDIYIYICEWQCDTNIKKCQCDNDRHILLNLFHALFIKRSLINQILSPD